MPPWARAAVDVLGEVDDTGRYAYPLAVILVPRQSAKTTTALDVALGRGMLLRDYRAAYAAQTGHVTTERMGDRFTEVSLSALKDRTRVRRSAGTERLTLPSTGSYVKAFPPIDGALRSSALDLVIVDEGQEHADDPLGRALDHTIMPTFTTRPRRQLLILGTAPALPGTYLERYAALARAGAPGVALVDYGADVAAGDDLDDPRTWERRHPGLAAGLTDLDYLTSQHALDREGFYREHLNVWPRGNPGAVIPAAAWERAQAAAMPPAGARVHLALDVAPQGAYAAVAAAWATPTGVHVAVVQAGEGTSWVDAALPDLERRWAPSTLTWDQVSPAAGVIARVRPSTTARPVGFGDVAAASAWVLEAVCDDPPRLTVTPDPDLDVAAGAATKRVVGDTGRWAWGRRASGAPIAPLVAVTLAAWSAAAPPPEPFLI